MRPETATTRSHLLDLVFLVGLLGKGLDGLAELVGGVALVALSPGRLQNLLTRFTSAQLAQDPDDFIAQHLLRSVAHLSEQSERFVATYLLIHGLVKVAIVVAIFLGTRRLYPWAIGALSLLTIYQVYLLIKTPSVGVALLIVLDVAIILLTIREWRENRTLRETWHNTRNWLRSGLGRKVSATDHP